MRLKLAISPCPNDTFAFYHMVHNPPPGIEFSVSYLDIEELNRGALKEEFDIVKVSFATGYLIQKNYTLLNAGSALGFGVGPVLIALNSDVAGQIKNHCIEKLSVLLPGEHTSAHVLFQFYADRHLRKLSPDLIIEKKFTVFSDILKKLSDSEADLGVLIHEGRFVYQKAGFHLVEDLGRFWEEQTRNPVPLGGIFMHRQTDTGTRRKITDALKESISRAEKWRRHESSDYRHLYDYMKLHSQETEKSVIENHIDLYVNSETESLTPEGLAAVDRFYRSAEMAGIK